MPLGAKAAQYVFPVLGSSSFSNDYDAARGSTRHNAIDIIAKKHQQIVSATDGTVMYVTYPEPSWGNAVVIKSTGGYCYWYIHMNNDDPGTDNGRGGAMKAFAPDMKAGNPVKAGQLLGWVGDSGSSEDTVPHLHFEVLKAGTGGSCSSTSGTHVNPYNSLKSARRITSPVAYGVLPGEMLPYGPNSRTDVRIASMDANTDGTIDYVVGTGPGVVPRVRILTSTGVQLYSINPFNTTTKNGTDVAVGDVDGDGGPDIITAAVTDSGPRVAIHSLQENGVSQKISEFGTFGTIKARPSVATGDFNSDGTDEIIVSTGEGVEPKINIFDKDGRYLESFHPYALEFKGGVDVAAGNVISGSPTRDELVVSPQTKGSSRVIIYSIDPVYTTEPVKIRDFYAYGSAARNGSRVAIGNVNRSTTLSEIVTMPHKGASPVIKTFDGVGRQLSSAVLWEEWWRGYYDVTADDGLKNASAGFNRRSSIR